MTTLRPFFQIRLPVTLCLIAALTGMQLESKAVDVHLSGRADSLLLGGSFSRWAPPLAGDTLVYGANYGGALTQALSPTGTLPLTMAFDGIRGVAGSTGLLTLQAANPASATTQTLQIGAGGIDLSKASGNLTLNKTNGNGTMAVSLTASQAWLVGAGRTLTVSSDITGAQALTLTTLSGGASVATLSGLVNLAGGSLTVNNRGTGAIGFTGTGNLTANSLTVTSSNTGATTFSGPVIAPTASVTTANTGAVTFSGAVTSTNSLSLTSRSTGNITVTGLATAGTLNISNLAGATIALNGGQTPTTAVNITNAAGGTVTLAGNLTGGSAAIMVNNNSSGTVNLNGTITGSSTLTLVNNNPGQFGGVLSIAGATNTFTGATSLTGGTTNLVYTTNNNNKLADAALLTLNRAKLNITGNLSGGHTEVVSGLALGTGFSQITRTAATTGVLAANNITRSNGSVLDFGAASIVTTDRATTNGIIGGWATLNGTDWAVSAAGSPNDVAVTALAPGSYTNGGGGTSPVAPALWAAGQNITVSAAPSAATGTQTVNSLRMTGTTAFTVTQNAATTLTLDSGGFLATGNGNKTITGGSITAGTVTNATVFRAGATNSELFFHINQATANPVTVASTIVDGAAGSVGLVKTFGGVMVLTGANTYTGPTTIGGGTLQIGANGTTGTLGASTAAISNDGLLDFQRTDAVTVANSITGIGAVRQNNATSVLTLSGSNSYYGTTTAALGTIRQGAAGGFSPNSQFVTANVASSIFQLNGFDATILGLSGGGAAGGNFDLGANTLTIAGNATQTYSGVLSGTGSLVKNGTGVLTLPATTTFTGAVTLNDGGLILPSSTAHTNVTATGGALTMAGNNALSGNLAASNAAVVVMAGNNAVVGTTTLANDANVTMNGLNIFTGTVSVNDNAIFTATGTNTFTNGLTVATAATVSLPGNNTYGGPVALNNTAALTLAGNNSFSTLDVNAGSLTLTGNNTGMSALTIGAATVTSNRVGGAIPDATNVSLTTAGGGLNVLESEAMGSLASVFNTQLRLAAGKTLDISSSSDTTIDGVIAGGSGVNKNGSGVLTLAGGNTFQGSFNINAGSVVIAPSIFAPGVASFIGDTTAVTLASGTSLNLALSSTRGETVGSLNGQGSVLMGSNGTLTTGGNNNSTTLSGAITSTVGGTLIKLGSGNMTLSNSNTFTSGLRIEGGGVTLAHVSNTLADTLPVQLLRNGTSLNVTNSETVGSINGVRNSVVNIGAGATLTASYEDGDAFGRIGTTANGARTIFGFNQVPIGDVTPGMQIVSPTNGIPAGTWVVQTFGGGASNSPGALLSDNTTDPGVTDTINFRRVGVLASSLTGAGGFNKNGAGALIFAGNNSNEGDTTLNRGLLMLGGIEAGGQYVLGNVFSDQSTLVFGNIPGFSHEVRLADNGSNLQSFERLGGLAGGSNTTLSAVNIVSGGNFGTLAVGANNQSTTFYGAIRGDDASGRPMFIKEGTGVLTYLNLDTNAFDGTARIDGGEIYMPYVLPSYSSTNVGIGDSASLILSNRTGVKFTSDVQSPLRQLVGGAGVVQRFRDGAVGALAGNYISGNGGEVALPVAGQNLILTGVGLGTVEFSGAVTGLGGLTKTGNSVVSLSGINTYHGLTNIGEGLIQLSALSRTAGLGSAFVSDRRGSLSNDTNIEISGGSFALNNLDESVASIAAASSSRQVLLGRGTLTILNQVEVSFEADKFKGQFLAGGGLARTGEGYANIGGLVVTNSNLANTNALVLKGTRVIDGPTLTIGGYGIVSLESTSVANQGVLADTTRVIFDNSGNGKLNFHENDPFFGEAIGSIHGNGQIDLGLNRTLTLTEAGGLTAGIFTGSIVGTGTSGLTVSGRGSITLSGANTYTGVTVVENGGELTLDTGSGAGAANIVPSGSALTLGGGSLHLDGGRDQAFSTLTLAPGVSRINRAASFTGEISISGLNFEAGSALLLPTGTVVTSGVVNRASGILGGQVLAGGESWATVGAGGMIQAYSDSGYSTSIGAGLNTSLAPGPAGNLTIGSSVTDSLRFNDHFETIISGNPVDVGHTLTLSSGSLNVASGGILVTRATGAVTSTITGGGHLTSSSGQLTLHQQSELGELVIDSTISGVDMALVKSGPGRVILAQDNLFSGPVSVGRGVLQIGNGGSTGSLGSGTTAIYNNGIIDVHRTGITTFQAPIFGSGSLVVSSDVELVLDKASTYSGKTNILSGRVFATNADGALGSALSATSVESGATLAVGADLGEDILLKGGYLVAETQSALSGKIVLDGLASGIGATGSETVTIKGRITSPLLKTMRVNGDGASVVDSGSVAIANTASYGSTIIHGGSLIITNDTTNGTNGTLGSGSISNDGVLIFDLPDSHRVVANNISGTGGLVVRRNTTYLTGNNNYQGNTVVGDADDVFSLSAAVLRLGNDSFSGDAGPGGDVNPTTGVVSNRSSLEIYSATNGNSQVRTHRNDWLTMHHNILLVPNGDGSSAARNADFVKEGLGNLTLTGSITAERPGATTAPNPQTQRALLTINGGGRLIFANATLTNDADSAIAINNNSHVEFSGDNDYTVFGALGGGGSWVYSTSGTTTLDNTGVNPSNLTAILSGWNGNVYVNRGTLKANASNQLGDDLDVYVTKGATLLLNGNGYDRLGGLGVQAGGKISLGGSGGDFDLVVDDPQESFISGQIAGSGRLIWDAANTMTLIGERNPARLSDFTGQLVIRRGIVRVDSVSNTGVDSAIGAGAAIALGPVELVDSNLNSLGTSLGVLDFIGGTTGTQMSSNRDIILHGSNGDISGGQSLATAGSGGGLSANGRGALVWTGSVSGHATGSITATAEGNQTFILTGESRANNIFSGVIEEQSSTQKISLVKNGNSYWALTSPDVSDYSGQIEVNGGVLEVQAIQALGNLGVTRNFQLGAGRLLFNTTAQTIGTAISWKLNGSGEIANVGNGALVVAGAISQGTGSAGRNLILGGSNIGGNLISGVISGANVGITKNESGLWRLSASNSFGGGVVINAGTLEILGGNAIPDTAGVSLANAGANGLAPGESTMAVISSETIGSLSGVAGTTVNIASGQTLTLVNANGNFQGKITGAGGVTQSTNAAGSARETLLSSDISDYTGTTSILGGAGAANRLNIARLNYAGLASSIGAGSTPAAASAGSLVINTGANGGGLRYVGVVSSSTDRLMTIGAGSSAATLWADGQQYGKRVPTMGFESTGSAAYIDSGARTLTLRGGNRGDNVYNLSLADNGGATSISKLDASTWVIGGNSNYSGAVTVGGGTLAVTSNNALGASVGGVSVTEANSYLDLRNVTVANEVLTLGGGHLGSSPGAGGATSAWTGNVAVNASANISVIGTLTQLTVTGLLTGTGEITKLGDGTLVLSGSAANTNTGAFNARGGFITLDYTGGANLSKLADGAALVFGGNSASATTAIQGASTRGQNAVDYPRGTTIRLENGNHIEVVSAATVDVGASGVTRGLGSSTFSFGALTRNKGGTLDIGVSGMAKTTTDITTAVAGGYITVDRNHFATRATNDIVAQTTYGSTWAPATNTNVITATLSGAGATDLLRFEGGLTSTVNLTGPATINKGGILVSRQAGPFTMAINGGSLTSGNGNDLIIHQHNSDPSGLLNIGSSITGAIGLTKSGVGKLQLNGANTYTGGTFINEGLVQVGDGSAGTSSAVLGTGGMVLNGQLSFLLATGTEYILPQIRGGTTGLLSLPLGNQRTIVLNQDNGNYVGGFDVQGGTLAVASNNNALGNARASVSIGSTGVLQLRGVGAPSPATIQISAEISLDGKLDGTTGNSIVNGSITVNDSNAQFSVGSGVQMQINNQIYSSGGFRKTGDGRLILNAAMFEESISGTLNAANLPTLNKTPTLEGNIRVESGELWVNTPASAGGNGNTLFRNTSFFLGAGGGGNELQVSTGATFDLRDADLNHGDDSLLERKIIEIQGNGFNGTGALRNTSGTGTLTNLKLNGNATVGVGGIANSARLELNTFDTNPAAGAALPGVFIAAPSRLTGNGNALTKIGTGDFVLRDTIVSNVGIITISEGELRFERNAPPNATGYNGYSSSEISQVLVAYSGATRGDYTDLSILPNKSPIVGSRLEFYRNNNVTHDLNIVLDGSNLDTISHAAFGGTNYLELNSDSVPGSTTYLDGDIEVKGLAKRNIFNIEGADAVGAVFQQGNLTNGVQGKMVLRNGVTGTGGFAKIGFRELRLTGNNSHEGETIIIRSGSMGLPPRSDTVAVNGTEFTNLGEGESWGEWGLTLTSYGSLSATSAVTLERAGLLTLDNTTRLDESSLAFPTINRNDRVNDLASINMRQGWLRLHSNADDSNTEVIANGGGAKLNLLTGLNLIDLATTSGSNQNITLTIGEISRLPGTVLRFRSLDSTSSFSNDVAVARDSVRVALGALGGLTEVGAGTGALDRKVVIGLFGGIASHTAYEDIRQVLDFWNQERNRQNYTGSHFMTLDDGYLRPLDDSEYATVSNGLVETANVGGTNLNLADFIHISRNSVFINSLRFGPLADNSGNNVGVAATINDGTMLTGYTNNWQPTLIIDDAATVNISSGMVSSASFAVGSSFNLTTIIRGGALAFGGREAIINNQNLWLRLQDGTYNANNFELMTSVTGSSGLTKVGPGSVVLDGVNTYSGATIVSEGILFGRNGRNAFGANGSGNHITVVGAGDLRFTNGIVVGTPAAPKNLNIGLLNGDQQVMRSENGNNIFNGDIIYDNVDSVGHVQPGGARPRISVNANQTLVINGDLYGAGTLLTEDIYYSDARMLSLNGSGFISIRGSVGDKGVGGVAVPASALINAGPSVGGTLVNENQLMRLQITANDDLNVALEKQHNAAGRIVLDRGILLVNYNPLAVGLDGKGFWSNTAISRIKNGNSNSNLADNGFSTQHGFIIGQALGDSNGNTQALFLTRAGQVFNMSEWRVSSAAGSGQAWVGGTNEVGDVMFGAVKADGSLPLPGDAQFVGNLNLDKATRFYQQAGGTSIFNQRMSGGTFIKIGRGTVVLKNTSAVPALAADTSVTAAFASDTQTVEMGGGTLRLDYDGAAFFNGSTVSRLGNQNFVARGGVLHVQGNSGATALAGTVTQGFASDNNIGRSAQFLNGATTIIAEARGINSLTINIGNSNSNNGATNFARSLGATANFAAFNSTLAGSGVARINLDFNTNGATPGAIVKNQIIPWATFGSGNRVVTDFAISDATDGNRVRAFFRSPDEYRNDVTTWVAGDDVSEATLNGLGGSGFFGTLATSIAIGTVRFDSPADSVVSIAANQALVLANSGLLVSSNTGSANKTITGGSIATSVLKSGTLVSGLATVTGISGTSDLFVGMPVSGSNIPSGAYIVSIDSASQVSLSSNATASATLQPVQFGSSEMIVHHYGTGNLNLTSNFGRTISISGRTQVNSTTLTLLSSTAGLAPGMTVVTPNLPAGTTIVSVDSGTQITVSNQALATGNGQTFTIGVAAFNVLNGATVGGSTTIGAGTTIGIQPGMSITGTNIPAGAIVTRVIDATSFEISIAASATSEVGANLKFTVGSPQSLTITGISAFDVLNGATASGSTTVTMATTAGIVPGMRIVGPNIPAGATVRRIIDGTSLEISVAATATSAVGANLIFTVGSPQSLALGGQAISGSTDTASTGAVVLGGQINAITGKITVNGGVVSVSDDSALGIAPSTDVSDQLTLNGGTLRWTGGGGLLSQTRGVTLQGGGGVIDVTNSQGHLVVQRAVESFEQYRGDLVKTGAGTLTLEGDDGNQALFRGLLDVRQGTIRLAGDVQTLAAGTGSVTSTIFGSNQTWADGTILRQGTNMLLQMGSTNLTPEWNIEEFITFEGNNRVTVGTLGGATRTVNWNAPIAVDGVTTLDTVLGQTLRLGNAGGFIQGSGEIVKVGLGTLEFRENNADWSGALSILEGRVLAANQADVLGIGHTAGKSITLGSTEHAGIAELLLHSDLGAAGSLWEVNMPINVAYNPAQTKRLGVWKQQGNGGQNHQFNGDITLNDNLQLYYEEDNNAFPVGGEFVFIDYNGKFKDGAVTSGNLVLRSNATANGGNDNDATNGRLYVTHSLKGDNNAWTGDLVIGTSTDYGQDSNVIARVGNNLALTERNDVTMNYNTIMQVGGSSVTIGSLSTNGGRGLFQGNAGTMSSSSGATNVIENAAATPGVLTIKQSTPANYEVSYDAMFRDGTLASHWFVPGQSSAGASLSLVKDGIGWSTLTQINEHTGTTTVAAGTLQVGVNGIGTSGAARAATVAGLTLNAGATLAGTGLINGLTTLLGIVRPGDVAGDAMGTLTIDGNTVFGANSQTVFQINRPSVNAPELLDMNYAASFADDYNDSRDGLLLGASAPYAPMLSDPLLSNQHDRVSITGRATLNAAAKFDVVLNGYAPVIGDVFKLIDFGSVTGTVNVGSMFRAGGETGTQLNLPFLGDRLFWDTSLFNSSGIVLVVADTNGAPPAPTIRITTPLKSVVLPLGATSATFTARAVGPPTVTSQWRKKGVDIMGATGSREASYTVNAPGLGGFVAADVAKYSVRFVSDYVPAVTPMVSAEADLILVNMATSSVMIPAKGSTSFAVVAVGPTAGNIRYQWYKDGSPIADTTTLYPTHFTGTRTATLKISNMASNDVGRYTCRVFAADLTADEGLEAGARDLAMLLTPAFAEGDQELPKGKVSAAYGTTGYRVLMDTATTRLATKFAAAGLPPGLAIHPTTGVISGVPNTAGRYTEVKITASNAAGATVSANFTIEIEGVSERAIGTYVALVDRHAANGNLGGFATIVTTAKGGYSGRLTLGALTYPLNGVVNNSGANPHLSMLIKREPKLRNIQFEADLITTDDGGAGVRKNSVHGTVQEIALTGPALPTVNFAGWRNIFFDADIAAKKATKTTLATAFVPKYPSVAFLGSHNFMLTTDAGLDTDESVPHGASFGTARVDRKGIAVTAGKLADGSAYTFTAPIGENGEVAFFRVLYTVRGSLHGSVLIEKGADPELVPAAGRVVAYYKFNPYKGNAQKVTGPDASGPFQPYAAPTWLKPDQGSTSRDRVYRVGFGGTTGLELEVAGGLYTPPLRTGIVMGLEPGIIHVPGTKNAQVRFFDSATPGIANGVEDASINPNLDNSDANHPFFEVRPVSTVVLPTGAQNPGLTKVSFTAASGATKASCALTDISGGVTFKRAIAGDLMIIPNADTTSDPYDGAAYGYFLLDRLPVPPETLTSTSVPRRSGLVIVEDTVP